MKATSLTEANHKLELASDRDKRHRQVMKNLAGNLVHKGVGLATAGTFGLLRKKGVSMGVKGFPIKLGIWTIATITEVLTDGLLQQAAGGLGNQSINSYLENAIATGTMIAGEGEV